MAPVRRWLLAAALAFFVVAPLAGALIPGNNPNVSPVGVAQNGDADIPAVTAPVVVTAFQDEHWGFTEGGRTRLITVPVSPTGAWDRIVMVYREYPSQNAATQDPWDRLCSAGIAGVEVLRCTTPRTDFTLRKDVTEFASLLPQGQQVGIIANTGTYAGDGQWVTVKLEFYAAEPTKLAVKAPAASVVPAWYYRGLCAFGSGLAQTVEFPADAPADATAEILLSGHGTDEFWWETTVQPVFRLLVDGQEIGQVYPAPYLYAFIGFYGGDYTLHPYMWWTAQQGLDIAGVHTGVGEIPPYRVSILPTDLPLLTGARTVQLVGENGSCYWPSSVHFLMN